MYFMYCQYEFDIKTTEMQPMINVRQVVVVKLAAIIMSKSTHAHSSISPNTLFQSKTALRCASTAQCFQMAKFDPFLSLDCARVEGVGAQSKERKGSNFAA